VSDPTQEHSSVSFDFAYGAITLSGRPFQGRSSIDRESHIEVLQPPRVNSEVWALPFSLATTKGISVLISFPPVLRCFSSQSVLPKRL
jgi:hypothetical protein